MPVSSSGLRCPGLLAGAGAAAMAAGADEDAGLIGPGISLVISVEAGRCVMRRHAGPRHDLRLKGPDRLRCQA